MRDACVEQIAVQINEAIRLSVGYPARHYMTPRLVVVLLAFWQLVSSSFVVTSETLHFYHWKTVSRYRITARTESQFVCPRWTFPHRRIDIVGNVIRVESLVLR